MRIAPILIGITLICVAGAGENKSKPPSEKPFDRAVKILKFGQVNEYFGPAKGDAVAFLGLLGDERAVAVLTEHLANEDDAHLRFQITKALGWLKSRQAIPALQKALKDEDLHVRNGAAIALTRITGKQYQTEQPPPIPAEVLQELTKGLANPPQTTNQPGMSKAFLKPGETCHFAFMQRPHPYLVGKVLAAPTDNWVKIQIRGDNSETVWINLASVAYVRNTANDK